MSQHAPKGRIKGESAPMDDATHEGPQRARCTGHSSQTGEPCKKWPINGGTVCRTHGGAAPQVKAKAAERWSAHLVPLAVQCIAETIKARPQFPTPAFAASKFTLENEFGRAVETVAIATIGQLSDEELCARILALAEELRAGD